MSAMHGYYLWPRAPLVFRHGRPFGGSEMASTLPFPRPDTVAGALRARWVQGRIARGELPANSDEAWQAVFEQCLLVALLDVVRREVNPRTFQAFELFTLGEMPGREVARITGISRNAVYQARKNVFARLKELGAAYRKTGQLQARVKQVLESLPGAARQRSLTLRVAKTMRSRYGGSAGD